MNRRIVLLLVFMLLFTFSVGVDSVSSDGTVGVSVGQTFEYIYGHSGAVRYSNGTLNSTMPFYVENVETNVIQEISGTNITFRCVRDLLNGTKTMGQYWIDVSTGDGTAWAVFISAGVDAGDMIYPDWLNENLTTKGGWIANETITMKYRGADIEVNHLELMFTDEEQVNYYDYHYYWKKSTGLLIKCTKGYATFDEDGMLLTLLTHLESIGLQHIFYPYIDNTTHPIAVESTSTILGFEFNGTKKNLSLNVTGATGTSGHSTIMVPANLLVGPFSLNMDGYALVRGTDYSQTNNGTHYMFSISYIHSSNTIEIVGSEVNADNPKLIDPELTEPTEPTEPTEATEPEESTDAPFITTEVAIIAVGVVVAVIGVVAYWSLKRK